MKCAIGIIGQCFRLGGQGNIVTGTPEAYKEQMDACSTHINFIKSLSRYRCDVFINTESTQYDDDIRKVYSEYLVGENFRKSSGNFRKKQMDNIVSMVNLDEYEFIFFIRIDIHLKPEFHKVFNPTTNKLTYSFITWIKQLTLEDGSPRVADMMCLVPKNLFHILNKNVNIMDHGSWSENLKFISHYDMNLMIDTYHDSDSQKDWNPLYKVANRPESQTWHSKESRYRE
jgi:hypothetical protein